MEKSHMVFSALPIISNKGIPVLHNMHTSRHFNSSIKAFEQNAVAYPTAARLIIQQTIDMLFADWPDTCILVD
jgi:hypothetical protein